MCTRCMPFLGSKINHIILQIPVGSKLMNFENQDVPLFSRLHVSCSLDTTEESLQNIFSTFGVFFSFKSAIFPKFYLSLSGEVEHIKLIANRSTGQFMGVLKRFSPCQKSEILDDQ